MLEVGPRLLALADSSEEAARLASVYFNMLSSSCSARELVTVVLELFDVQSRFVRISDGLVSVGRNTWVKPVNSLEVSLS